MAESVDFVQYYYHIQLYSEIDNIIYCEFSLKWTCSEFISQHLKLTLEN